MGTINYKTSDYITLSIKPYDFDDIKKDLTDFFIYDTNAGNDQTADIVTDDYVYEHITDMYDCDKENAQGYIDKYNLYYFHVAIEPGYYEGLSINIDNNFPVFFDDYIEKKEAQKEITQLKKLLIDLADVGFVQTFPGWCTGYNDYKQTLKGIREAMKEVRQEVATTPTYRDYNANRHYKHM